MSRSTTQEDVFSYVPLDSSKKQIRLLRWQRDTSSNNYGSIYCTVKEFNLDRAPVYYALSYTWGPSRPISIIQVNGHPFSIRQNIYDFFWTVADQEYWWIDQLCIDQSDTAERSHQVSMMADIYRRASSVIIWLGNSGELDDAMRFLQVFDRYMDKLPDSQDFLDCIETKETSGEAASTVHLQPNIIDSMIKFVTHEYWERLWIVQEIILSYSLAVMHGGFYLQFVDFIHFRNLAKKINFEGVVFPNRIDWFSQNALRQEFHNPQLSVASFSELVDTFCMSKCQDLRDKVYGLQGMLKQAKRLDIDYARSVEDVFLDSANRIMQDWLPKLEEPQWYVRVILRLGTEMIPDKFSLHLLYDQLEPLKQVVIEMRDAAGLAALDQRNRIMLELRKLLTQNIGAHSFRSRAKRLPLPELQFEPTWPWHPCDMGPHK
jgi:hypothetical protein